MSGPASGAYRRRIILGKKLYVGNLPYTATEEELRSLFEEHGRTASVAVIMDRETGRSRGFGFVEFETEDGARAAQQALDGRDMGGRPLRVNEAQERQRGGGGGSYRSGPPRR